MTAENDGTFCLAAVSETGVLGERGHFGAGVSGVQKPVPGRQLEMERPAVKIAKAGRASGAVETIRSAHRADARRQSRRAQAKGLRPGDLLLFYLSQNKRLAASQCLTTIGIVEQCRESRTADELVIMTARRSVFSGAELAGIQAKSNVPVKVIDFLLAGHLTSPIPVNELLRTRIFNKRPPQSITRLDEARYRRLRPLLKLGFEL